MGQGKLKLKLAIAAAIALLAYQASSTDQQSGPACLAHGPATPVSAEEELAIGRLYYSNDDFPLAIEHFSNAIKADGQNGRLYYERGHAYYKLDQYIQAVPDYTRAISLKFSPSLNYERRAYCFLNNHQFKKALKIAPRQLKPTPCRGLRTTIEPKPMPSSARVTKAKRIWKKSNSWIKIRAPKICSTAAI